MSNEKELFLSELNALMAKHNCSLCVETKWGEFDDSFEGEVYSFDMTDSESISMEEVRDYLNANRKS